MVQQAFIDKIEDLRHSTYSRITSIQKEISPMIKTIYLNYQFDYWYKGYKHNLWEDNVHVYSVNELPFCYDNYKNNTTFIDTVDHLVEQDILWPFLFFVNGCAVQWSKIVVIHDYDYTYLKIKDILPDYSVSVDIIVFPISSKMIRYGEDSDILLGNSKNFYFDNEGKFLGNDNVSNMSLRLEILDDNIYYKKIDVREISSDYIMFDEITDGSIPTENNIITFDSDGIFTGNGFGTLLDTYNSSYNLFDVVHNSYNAWAIFMYNIKGNTEASHLYERYEDLNKQKIIDLLTSNPKVIGSEIWHDVITPLIEKFDFNHDRNLNYNQNIENATHYITDYDFRMWNHVFNDQTNIRSFTYTGEEFKAIADDTGYIHFSRKHGELIQDVVMVFVNSKLYQYETDITYTTNTINIPVFGIMDDDHVEILLFKVCNNNILQLKVLSPTEKVYIHTDYNLEDCYIMSNRLPQRINLKAYPVLDETLDLSGSPMSYIPSIEALETTGCGEVDDITLILLEGSGGGPTEYIIDFTYTKDEDGNYYIQFEDSFYYGLQLFLVPKRQFRYYHYTKTNGLYKLPLPDQFNFCHDMERFMIFVNGKKIDKSEFTVTIMNKNRPFYELILYLSTILDDGDYLDIFYLPEIFKEKYKQLRMPTSGLILLEDNPSYGNYPKKYPLSKYTTEVFVNGLKVNPLDIKDISMNSILINVDKYKRDQNLVEDPAHINSLDNITILEYISGDEYVAGFLKNFYEQATETGAYEPSRVDFNTKPSDKWKNLINTIIEKYSEKGTDKEYTGLQMLFGDIFEFTGTPDKNYKDDYANLRSVLYDIIIDYYLSREDSTTGDKFIYDFEREYFDEDSDGTAIITLLPDRDKLLDYIPTTLVATPEDVYQDKSFIGVYE